MRKKTGKHKKGKTIFICQVTDSALRAVKCVLANGSRREFTEVETESLLLDADEKKVSERLIQAFKKMDYNLDPVIVSLPRNSATSRFLRVPAQSLNEIEKIVTLQAPRLIPYSADELNSGFQVIQTDKEGYSDVNLVIVHKNIIERYIRIFKELKVPGFSVVLSSYGLCSLYRHILPQEGGPVMLLDIDSGQAESVITDREKLLFSRAFKLSHSASGWEDSLVDELNKTRDVYLKEVAKGPPGKIFILSAGRKYQGLAQVLQQRMDLPAAELLYGEDSGLSLEALNRISSADISVASLIGLGLEEVSEYLNLLPVAMKEETKNIRQRKEYINVVLSVCGIILIFSLGSAMNLRNKAGYLARLKQEVAKISKESRTLEEIEKRFQALENYSGKRISSLDVLYELHQRLPEEISLVNLIYEDDSLVTLRGRTQELNSVFGFVAELQKSPVFKKFNIKVKYATKKKTQNGEVIDFEITCNKEA